MATFGLVQLWHNKAFGAVCEIDNSGDVSVVKDVIDREVIVLKILPSYLAGIVHESVRQFPLHHHTHDKDWCLISNGVGVCLRVSRDEVHCRSVIFSVVAECNVKIFDDVDVFVAECHFGVSGTIS